MPPGNSSLDEVLRINIRAVLPFTADGGKPGFLLGVGNFGFSVIKKGSPDRVKEMLRVLNYLAAPFGSEEYMVARFGVKGVDYTVDAKGNPVVTDQGNADIAVHSWDYLAAPPTVAFSAYQPEFGKYGHDEETQFLAAGVFDPTSGRFSPTDEDKGAQLNQQIFDRVSAIAAGRAPLSDLDQLVKDWRSQGGDQIRNEFEQSPQIS